MLVSKFNLQPAEEEEEQKDTEIIVPDIEQTTEVEETEDDDAASSILDSTVKRKLKKSHVSTRLSVLGKTAAGDGYTYLKAGLVGLGLTNISIITCFKHLQFVDLSHNSLDIKSLDVVTKLPSLVLVQADSNILNSAKLSRAKYLQVIIMNKNNIASIDDVYQPELSTLEVASNQLQKINFEYKMPTLKCLDVRHNMIRDIANLDFFANLDSLYLSNNKIRHLTFMKRMYNLRVLHVRDNPLHYLNGFNSGMKKLHYINIRQTDIGTLRQVKKLKVLPALEALIMKGTPYMGGSGTTAPEGEPGGDEEENPEIRVEVLAALPRLKRLNKVAYTPEERQEANDLMMQWLEEGEKEEEEEEILEEEQQNVE